MQVASWVQLGYMDCLVHCYDSMYACSPPPRLRGPNCTPRREPILPRYLDSLLAYRDYQYPMLISPFPMLYFYQLLNGGYDRSFL